MKFGYYPGCALHGSSVDYEKSVRACLNKLKVDLEELDDWICCGATAAHSINQKLATALPVRNLGIAQKMGLAEVLAPCPMCSMELLKANDSLTDPAVQKEMSEIVELPVKADLTSIVNLIQIFQKIGIEYLVENQIRKLDEFKPACYYGCLLTRPAKILHFDDPEDPTSMELILSAMGSSPVEWNYKTECCGAGMTLCNPETVVNLSCKIIENAQNHGANCIVTACPMCQMNLDMRQSDIIKKYNTPKIPIYYLSDIIGLALGLSEDELGIKTHYVV